MGASGSDLTFGVLAPLQCGTGRARWVTAPSMMKLTQLLTVNFEIQTCRHIGTDLPNTKRLWLKDKPINGGNFANRLHERGLYWTSRSGNSR